MLSVLIPVSIIFAFLIPLLSALAVQNMIDKKPYVFLLFIVSVGFAVIVATLLLAG